jgi:hypothetical protein
MKDQRGSVFTSVVSATESAHICELCAEDIPIGQPAHYVTGEVIRQERSGLHSTWQHEGCWGTYLETDSWRRTDRSPHLVVRLAQTLELGS